jgi:hypothetical protein
MGLFDRLFGTKEIQPKPKIAVERVQSKTLDSETDAPGLKYKLRDLNVICLKTCKQNPSQRMYNYEFIFEGNPIKSAVIYSCKSGDRELRLDVHRKLPPFKAKRLQVR